MSDAPFDWWYESDFGTKIRQGIFGKLIVEQDTGFQNLKIFAHETLGKVLVLDDIIQTTTSDEFIYHEMYVRVPLLGHPCAATPDREISVLIIGGGDGGILREVLQHELVSRVVMVEIDAVVIEMTKEHLCFNGDYEDPRVKLIIGDGAAYAKAANTAKDPFDFVILDVTDPGGPSQVLYDETFHRAVLNILKDDGAMVRHLGIPSYQLAQYRPVLRLITEVFEGTEVYRATIPSYVGGDMALVVASKDGSSFKKPQISHAGRYYNEEIHEACFALPSWWREDFLPGVAR